MLLFAVKVSESRIGFLLPVEIEISDRMVNPDELRSRKKGKSTSPARPKEQQPTKPSSSRNNSSKSISKKSGGGSRCGLTCCCCYGVVLPLLLIAGGLTVFYFTTPAAISAVPYSLPSPPTLEGDLAPQNLLGNAEKWLEGKVSGPESLVIHQGSLYTGTYDGKILQIDLKQGKILKTIRLGQGGECGSIETEHICGRPLGLRMHPDGTLIAVDAYLGLFKVNVTSGKFERLLAVDKPIAGAEPKFLNDLDILADGTILFTDSSMRWQRREFPYILLESAGDGRLLSFDPRTKEVKVLLPNLHFANGVQLSSDQSFVLVSETSRMKIAKYYLTGPKKGKRGEIFMENLPGTPDNIRLDEATGNFLIGFGTNRQSGKINVLDLLGPVHWLRNLLAKLFPRAYLPYMLKFDPAQRGTVVVADPSGKIVKIFQDPTGATIKSVSEAQIYTDESGSRWLYLGSYYAPFIGRIKLSSIA